MFHLSACWKKMHRKHNIALLCLAALIAMLASACGSKDDYAFRGENGDASGLGDILLAVREYGSGTRYEFENYLGISMDENGKDLYADMEGVKIQDNGSGINDYLAQNKNAIGYLSFLQKSDDQKALAVNGIICSKESISQGNYPLTREFSLCWASDVENLLRDDFVRYINSAGQQIVSEKYVSIGRGTGTFLYDEEAKGELIINGSSSVEPLLTELADSYMEINKNAQIVLIVSDSTTGYNNMYQGNCDVAMMSRELKDYEKEMVERNIFAKDGIAIVVDKNNPIEKLSLSQLKAIFTGEVKSWGEI